VNHSVEFKTKEGHHTNHIEGMWRIVRKELQVRWSRCGTNDPIQQDNRVQFGAWVINHRLGNAETGIVQAMMVLLLNNDRSKPPGSAFDVNRVPEQESNEERAARRANDEERRRQECDRRKAAKAELAQAKEALKEARTRMWEEKQRRNEERRNTGRTPTPAPHAPAPAQEG
jgi:hypothetical protein